MTLAACACWSFRQWQSEFSLGLKSPCADFFEIPTWRNKSMTFPRIKVLFLKLFNKLRLGFHIMKMTVIIAMSQSNDKKSRGGLNIFMPSEPSTENRGFNSSNIKSQSSHSIRKYLIYDQVVFETLSVSHAQYFLTSINIWMMSR